MGTRSLTYVYDETENPLLCMYAQWDGYPSGHGRALSDFLQSFDAIVNGININETRRIANGMGCLAAQLIANFKTRAGDYYLHPVKMNQDCWQEYEYHIFQDKVSVLDHDGEELFTGTWKQFADFCTARAIA